jgi:predicted lipid-binding transport protein (Tim44 family)
MKTMDIKSTAPVSRVAPVRKLRHAPLRTPEGGEQQVPAALNASRLLSRPSKRLAPRDALKSRFPVMIGPLVLLIAMGMVSSDPLGTVLAIVAILMLLGLTLNRIIP